MQSCEALVIGGGPAGSTCAARLRQAGLDVLLLDAQVFPREKPCAGWITPEALKTLGIDADEYRLGRVLQDIRGFVTCVMTSHISHDHVIYGSGIATRYDDTVSYGIRRPEFDLYLLQRCAGRQVLGERADTLKQKDGRWIVNGRYTAQMVVGAGGHSCPVARQLGAKFSEGEIIVAQAAEFALDSNCEGARKIRDDMPELFFSPDLKGYGWIVRKGSFLNVGFGRMGKGDFGRHMAGFRTIIEKRGVAAPGAVVQYRGHAYLAWQGHKGRNRIGDGLLLIGDSAGLAHPHSGEGILPAIESALLAADAIVAANGDYRRDNLEPYLKRLNERHSRGNLKIPCSIPGGLMEPIGVKLLSNRLFVRHILLDRWFLHRRG